MANYTKTEAVQKGILGQLVYWTDSQEGDTVTEPFGDSTITWAITDYTARGLQLVELSNGETTPFNFSASLNIKEYDATTDDFPETTEGSVIVFTTSGTVNGVEVVAGQAYIATTDTEGGVGADWERAKSYDYPDSGSGTNAEMNSAPAWIRRWENTDMTDPDNFGSWYDAGQGWYKLVDGVSASDSAKVIGKVFPEAYHDGGSDWTSAVNDAIAEASSAIPREGVVLSRVYDVSEIAIDNTNTPSFIECNGGGFRGVGDGEKLFYISNPVTANNQELEIKGVMTLDAAGTKDHALYIRGAKRLTGGFRTYSARSHGAVLDMDAGYGIYYSGDIVIDGKNHGGDGVHIESSEDDPGTPEVDEALNRCSALNLTVISHYCRGRGLFSSHGQNNINLIAEQCGGVGAHIEKSWGNRLNIIYQEHCGDVEFSTPYGDGDTSSKVDGEDVALYVASDAYFLSVTGSRVVGSDKFEDGNKPYGYMGLHRPNGTSPVIVGSVSDLPNYYGVPNTDASRFFVSDIGKDAIFDGEQYRIGDAYLWSAFFASQYEYKDRVFDNGDVYILGGDDGEDLKNGDRSALISVTENGFGSYLTSSPSNLVNGVVDPSSPDNSWTSATNNIELDGSQYLKFDLSRQVVVTGVDVYTVGVAMGGNWRVEGSNDDSTYTALSATEELDVNANWSFENATAYRYIKLVGVSGTITWQYLKEVEFSIDPLKNDASTRPSSQDGSKNSEWWLVSRQHVIDGSGETLATVEANVLPDIRLYDAGDTVKVENLDTANGEYQVLIFRKEIKNVSGDIVEMWEVV